MSDIPVGFCQCGCGRTTPIAKRNHTRNGHRKGHHTRFVQYHTAKRGTGSFYHSMHLPGRGIVKTHIAIAEAALGRPLPDGAEVHHVDHNKRNNVPSNLVICQDKAYHLFLHVRARVVRAGGDPNTQRICHRCRHVVNMADLVGSR